MDIARIQSLLQQQKAKGAAARGDAGPGNDFTRLLEETSKRQKEASSAAEKLITTGEGELHDVQVQLAKADVTFRLLLEVRNKLTEAYQEISRIPV